MFKYFNSESTNLKCHFVDFFLKDVYYLGQKILGINYDATNITKMLL